MLRYFCFIGLDNAPLDLLILCFTSYFCSTFCSFSFKINKKFKLAIFFLLSLDLKLSLSQF